MLKFLFPAALVAVFLLTACDQTEGEIVATLTPAPTLTATPAPTGTATVTAAPTPPPGWAEYMDPCGRFALFYPSGWFVRQPAPRCDQYNVIFSTFELGTVGPTFPPGSIKVEVSVAPIDVLSYCEPPGASPASLAGLAGWELAESYTDTSKSGGVTAAHTIGSTQTGLCISVAAYFAQSEPDVATFEQIVSTFQFGQ